MEFLDYYALLGIAPSASDDELREAYRLAARRFHPDANHAPGAAVAFRDVNAAYEVLSDRSRRTEYDLLWQDRASASPSLLLDAQFSRHHLKPMDEPQLLYVMLKAQPLLEMSLSSDAPLNLSLVVDRSTSMKGTRLRHVKNAVHRMIDETSPDDIISVITFSDRAEVLVPAQHPEEPREIKAVVSTIRADGATAIYSGLQVGLAQIERYRNTRYVNHLVLITDGRTYGDEDDCLRLASDAHERGVGISGMGIGDDWNDRFLDSLASRTGGSSAYIHTSESVSSFLEERIRSLATAFAERTQLIIAPSPSVNVESLVRVSPNPMLLDSATQPLPLGTLDGHGGLRLVVQFHVHTGADTSGEFFVGRVDLGGEVLGAGVRAERVVRDLYVDVSPQDVEEDPPPELLDALSKLALHKLQDRAREALDVGDFAEATRRLEYLATRLFETGQEELGQAALHEARRVASTRQLSEEGIKQLNYGTRALMLPSQGDENG